MALAYQIYRDAVPNRWLPDHGPWKPDLIASGGTLGTIIRVASGVTATINAPIVDPRNGHAELIKNDPGTLILTGANTYTGGTTINAGTLQVGNGSGTGSIVGNVVDNGAFAIDYSVLFAFRFSGNITGSGALKTTGTAVELSGVNTYSGPTIILQGGLIAKSATAFSPNSQFDVAAGAVLDPNGYNCTIGSLTGFGLVRNGNPGTTSILSVGQDNSSTTFSGEILNNAGAVGLNKIGSGTLTLNGVVRATGGITISPG